MKIAIPMYDASAFDAADLELGHQSDKPLAPVSMRERARMAEKHEAENFHKLLSEMRFRIDQEMHKLAAHRDKLEKSAVAKATMFINGLKRRYNQLYHKYYGAIYYKSVAGSSTCKTVLAESVNHYA